MLQQMPGGLCISAEAIQKGETVSMEEARERAKEANYGK